jgi:hypothetical protein
MTAVPDWVHVLLCMFGLGAEWGNAFGSPSVHFVRGDVPSTAS